MAGGRHEQVRGVSGTRARVRCGGGAGRGEENMRKNVWVRLAVCAGILGAPGAGAWAGDETAKAVEAVVEDVLQDAKTPAARAVKLYEASRAHEGTALEAPLLEKAAEYGIRAAGTAEGREAADKALALLIRKAPDKQDVWHTRRASLHRRVYRQARMARDKREAGQKFLDVLFEAGAAHERRHRYSEAMRAYREAKTVAASAKFPGRKREAAEGFDRARDRKPSHRKVARYRKVLGKNPADASTRVRLIEALIVEMDDPNAAAAYLAEGVDEGLRTYVPLAARPVGEVAPDACRELGDWYYKVLAPKAAASARWQMVLRAKGYYERFLTAEGEADDLHRAKVRVALHQINRAEAKRGATFSKEILRFAKLRDRLPPDRQIEALRKMLSDVNGGVKVAIAAISRRGRKIVGLSVRHEKLVSIEPLVGMPLTRLRLTGCKSLKSLKGLHGMPLTHLMLGIHMEPGPEFLTDLGPLEGMKLQELYLAGCRSLSKISLEVLQGMPLDSLDLSGVQCLTDLAPLKGLELKKLAVLSSTSLKSLTGIEGMPLTSLTLRGNTSLTDLAPLKGMKLTKLDIEGCTAIKSLAGIENMPITILAAGDEAGRGNLNGFESLTSIAPLRQRAGIT